MRLSRRRAEPRIRYYLYVSDTKLDMLFDQLDHSALKRITAEVKVDLKLASVTLKRADNPALARSAKLRVVERFIERHHHVGTVEDPGNEYFRGHMEMAWGWLRRPPVDGMVLFQGRQSHKTVVLAGSSQHVLGEAVAEEEVRQGQSSHLSLILWALNEHISKTPELIDAIAKEKRRNPHGWPDLHEIISYALKEPFFPSQEFLRGPSLAQSLEFLAVPLLQGRTPNRRFNDPEYNTVLGTPLYVAIASGLETPAPPVARTDQNHIGRCAPG